MTRQSQNTSGYRSARRAFIALCQKARADSVARVHPSATAPDGGPLFIDSVAFGPRQAKKALLVITARDGRDFGLGAEVLGALLEGGIAPMEDRRLVLVHPLNPFGAAWERRENEEGFALDGEAARQSWSFAMLRAIVAEDLARCEILRVLEVTDAGRAKVKDDSSEILGQILGETDPGLALNLIPLALEKKDAELRGPGAIRTALAGL